MKSTQTSFKNTYTSQSFQKVTTIKKKMQFYDSLKLTGFIRLSPLTSWDYKVILSEGVCLTSYLCAVVIATVPDYAYHPKTKAVRHAVAWGERRYSSYSFSTSALDEGEWSASRPGRTLAPGKGPPVPIAQEAGLAPEPDWMQ
jgi:hypothetical protein